MESSELKRWLEGPGRSDTASRIVRLLSQVGSLSSAEIARRLDVSKSTVSSAIADLRASGMIVDAEKAAQGPRAGAGRPSTALTLNPLAGVCIGVTIGPTFLRAAMADVSHAILDEAQCEMGRDYSTGDAAAAASRLVDAMCARSQVRRDLLLGVGIAVPGPVRPDTGEVLRASIVPAWAGSEIRGPFEAAFGLPIFADNESNCSALAEMTWGAAVGCDDFVYCKIDIGLGGAIVVNRKVLTGKAGGAGEFGHMAVDPHGDLCVCGNRGCLELTGSLGAALRRAEARFGPGFPIERLIELAKAGDVGCRGLIEEAAEAAGRGLALIGSAFNPPLIVIGGRGALAGEILLAPLRAAYDRYALIKNAECPPEIRTPIIAGAFPQYDASLGAVCLVLRHHGRVSRAAE